MLTHAQLHGNAQTIGSVNTLSLGGFAPLAVDLYINGERSTTLLTIPSGASTVDVHSRPDVLIMAGDEVRFVVPVRPNTTGALLNFLFAFSVG